jgi:hypothetical protein
VLARTYAHAFQESFVLDAATCGLAGAGARAFQSLPCAAFISQST